MKTSKRLALKNGSNFHTHLLTSNAPFSYKELEKQNSFEIFLTSNAIITHQEHGTILLNKEEGKKYIVCSQSEFDPFKNNFREVYD